MSDRRSRGLITIDRSTSRRSRPFEDPAERLWRPELRQILRLIEDHIKSLDRFNQAKPNGSHPISSRRDSAPNLSLAIFGPAGSGKSSLLKTLVFEAQRSSTHEELSKFLPRINALDVLQPARFGELDHLVYAAVAAGLDAYRRNQGGSYEFQPTTSVIEAYRKLAPHLRVLHPEKVPEDLEPHGLAAELIERHSSALVLRDRLGQFFDEVAVALGGKDEDGKTSVVLLPVDDLDLSPDHLYQGLRELQAYLLHPRIIPVFCFTDRLAEEILGNALKEKVGAADQKRQENRRLPVSEQLALQFLSKCFPVRNRIRLGPIPAKLQAATLRGRARGFGDDGEETKTPVLHGLLAASVLLFGMPDREARHDVRAALRPSTLRRQFHVLDSMKQEKVDQLVGPWMESLVPGTGQSWGEPKFDEHVCTTFDRSAWALVNVHRDVLREYGLYVEDLFSWTPHALRRVLLRSLFSCPELVQVGLWQRWRNLTDSRRSQVISLLAANAHRPWIPSDRPSGEDKAQNSSRKSDSPCDDVCGAGHQLSPALGLLWLLDVLVGFYLPLSRSIDRQIRLSKDHSHELLTGSGWSFHSAPVQAALAADDDEVLFSTAMMFLDPLSFATALTTSARIEACRKLDEFSPQGDEEWDRLKKLKVRYLQFSTRKMLETCRKKDYDEFYEELLEPRKKEWEKLLSRAGDVFNDTAAWESGQKFTKLKKYLAATGPDQFEGGEELRRDLEGHDYDSAMARLKSHRKSTNEQGNKAAVKRVDEAIGELRKIRVAARAVHDDQLLLRVWTCYGFNRGRFWVAVSLWRGLGLIGGLLESYRQWYSELEHSSGQPKRSKEKMAKKIEGVLHRHSLRGLVPGKDVGGLTQQGMLQMAFPSWDSLEQRKAIHRLAQRLESWLWASRSAPCFDIFQVGASSSWAQCFVRRLHGGYIVGSLWQWLDAEHLEYQGRQYSGSGSYLWNAGVALTSWMRVLLKYLRGAQEVRWLLETCPLTSPFLSPAANDPFSESLCEMPYTEMLKCVAEAPGADEPGETGTRRAEWFERLDELLREQWVGEQAPRTGAKIDRALKALVPESLPGSPPSASSSDLKDLLLKDKTTLNEDAIKKLLELSYFVHRKVLTRSEEGKEDQAKWPIKSERSRQAMKGAPPGLDVRGSAKGSKGAGFELASLIQQRLKLVAHASTTSLFYQIPRIRRRDFFSQRHSEAQD